jgi:tetratricopeptide (TPR) repeat protein
MRPLVWISAIVLLLRLSTANSMAGMTWHVCTYEPDPSTTENCTTAIASGRFSGVELAELYLARGNAWRLRGMFDSVIADFSEAIQLDPKLAEAFCGRGYSYYKKQDNDLAISDFSEAIRLKGDDYV